MKHGPVLVLGAVVLAAAAAAGGWTAGRGLAGSADPGTVAGRAATVPAEGPGAQVEIAARATVRLTPPGGGYVGSGTVVSDDGLVLTSAHVAAPQAPGLVELYDRASTAEDPPFLVVGVAPGGGGPVLPRFRATVVAVDGYLDLAVLRITATLEGRALRAGQRFPSIPVGRGPGLAAGERIEVLGYPVAVARGERLSSESGRVISASPDPTGRVRDRRYSIDTSARITGGYSGGAVIDAAGQLVGVPSSSLEGDRAFGRVRPVGYAAPLLLAARSGRPYTSPYTVTGTGRQRAQPRGWGPPGRACEDLTATSLEAGTPAMAGAAQFSGMTRGEDVLFTLWRTGVAEPLGRARSTWGPDGAEGCMSSGFSAAAVGLRSGFPAGTYQLRVQVGPDLVEVTTVRLLVR